MTTIFPFKRQYQTLNQINVKGDALYKNYQYFQNQSKHTLITPVLKSNAYGHGLIPVGQWIDQNLTVPFICVDSLYEAYELYKAKIRTPILIIGYTFPKNFRVYKKLPFSFPAFDTNTLKALNKHQPGAKVHLKIDTGMNRLGFQPTQITECIHTLEQCRNLQIQGIYSHLSQADSSKIFTNHQLRVFKKVIIEFEKAGISFKWRHITASAGTTFIDDPLFNLTRLGLGFYGISPITKLQPFLQPALTLTTHLVQIKRVEEGSQISYGSTYKIKKPTLIGIIPIGYYDGIDRRLSNQGFVQIEDTLCPILGRVCMNVTIIDITKVDQPHLGQPVTVISDNPKDKNSLIHIAKATETIPYETLVNLAESTKRSLIE